MREIEFRGKRIDNGKWVYGYYVFQKECKRIGSNEVYYANYDKHLIVSNRVGEYWEVAPETVGQYTGLKDKNGKKIYGGDIACCTGGEHCQGYYEYQGICEVKWQGNGFDLIDIRKKHGWGWGFIDTFEQIEVIGNIHENPELLE